MFGRKKFTPESALDRASSIISILERVHARLLYPKRGDTPEELLKSAGELADEFATLFDKVANDEATTDQQWSEAESAQRQVADWSQKIAERYSALKRDD